jgi:hypothetical protein
MSSTFLSNVTEEPQYRIDKVKIHSFGSDTEMFQLRVKINNAWFFVINREYDFYLQDLNELGQGHSQSKGFFCHYGKGDIEKEVSDELRRDMAYFVHAANGVWKFCGNHEHYSGAFQYYVWDAKLIEKIKEAMTQQGFKMEANGEFSL